MERSSKWLGARWDRAGVVGAAERGISWSQTNICSVRSPDGRGRRQPAHFLRTLFNAHPRILGLDDLGVAIPDPAAVEFAVTQLASDGLATKLGARVGATRPAVRFRALSTSLRPTGWLSAALREMRQPCPYVSTEL